MTAEKKISQLKTRSPEDEAILLYMAYQQQHFLNDYFAEAIKDVDEDCKVYYLLLKE